MGDYLGSTPDGAGMHSATNDWRQKNSVYSVPHMWLSSLGFRLRLSIFNGGYNKHQQQKELMLSSKKAILKSCNSQKSEDIKVTAKLQPQLRSLNSSLSLK